jgi:hypothetical protein
MTGYAPLSVDLDRLEIILFAYNPGLLSLHDLAIAPRGEAILSRRG